MSAVGGYDSNEEEFAIKGRVDITPTDMFSFFVMGAWSDVGDDDDDAIGGNDPDGNYYAQWGGEWGSVGWRCWQHQRRHDAQRRIRHTTNSATTRSTPT